MIDQDITINVTDWIEHPIALGHGGTEAIIGDIHGYADQFLAIRKAILSDFPDAEMTLLGDLIDRGPNSLEALKLAARCASGVLDNAKPCHWLPGNHEQMLVGTLLNPQSEYAYALLNNGGPWVLNFVANFRKSLEKAVDFGVAEFFQQAPLYRAVGNVIMVHAGIDPFAPDPISWLNQFQLITELIDDCDPIWIRERFHYHKLPFAEDVLVIHGHTHEHTIIRGDTEQRPDIGDHRFDGSRLGLDGGSYNTGCITGAVLRNGGYKIYTVRWHVT